MPTSLLEPLTRFNVDLKVLRYGFNRLTSGHHTISTLDRIALQEGLVSQLWQAWGNFARSILISSAAGGITASSAGIASVYAANTVEEICYVAMKAANGVPIGNIKPISGSHNEPTWGDPNKFALIANVFGTSNSNTLVSAVSLAIFLKDLQSCRNACAHLSSDRILDIKSFQPKYNQAKFRHPSDMIRWIDPVTNDFLWFVWIDEMQSVASLAVQ